MPTVSHAAYRAYLKAAIRQAEDAHVPLVIGLLKARRYSDDSPPAAIEWDLTFRTPSFNVGEAEGLAALLAFDEALGIDAVDELGLDIFF